MVFYIPNNFSTIADISLTLQLHASSDWRATPPNMLSRYLYTSTRIRKATNLWLGLVWCTKHIKNAWQRSGLASARPRQFSELVTRFATSVGSHRLRNRHNDNKETRGILKLFLVTCSPNATTHLLFTSLCWHNFRRPIDSSMKPSLPLSLHTLL